MTPRQPIDPEQLKGKTISFTEEKLGPMNIDKVSDDKKKAYKLIEETSNTPIAGERTNDAGEQNKVKSERTGRMNAIARRISSK